MTSVKQEPTSQQTIVLTTPNQKEVTISEAMKLAAQYHNAGRLPIAEKLYREILLAQPGHADATHLLGVIAHQKGQHQLAVQLINKAINLQPNLSEAYNNLGLIQQTLLEFGEAASNYRQALLINPKFAEAHSNLGVTQKELGKIEDAVNCYHKALAIKPDFAEAHYNLGEALRQLARPEEAITSYNKALKYRPRYSEALNSLGSILRNRGKLKEAISSYRTALSFKPEYAEAHNNLGNALCDLGNFDEAIASFQKALKCKPNFAEALNNLGVTLHGLNQLWHATSCYRRALKIKPEYAEVYNNLGSALRDLKKTNEATENFRKAIQLKPDFAEAHCNLGHVMRHIGMTTESASCYKRALKLKPAFPEAHNGLGNALREMREFNEAEASYKKALLLDPDFAEAHNNLGMMQLLTGNFEAGWHHYQWRKKLTEYQFHPRNYDQSEWDGGSFKNKTLFVHPEQGFGDFFQFIRYVPLIANRGGNIIVEVPKLILQLAKHSKTGDVFVTNQESVPSFDYHISLMDLPRIFGTNLVNVPRQTPYLTVPPTVREAWQERFKNREEFRLGIVWAGNSQNRNLHYKSVDVSVFKPLCDIPGIKVYSLQKDREDEATTKLGKGVEDLAPFLADFSETAGAISQLDLVVSVDTAVAHLAGALGHNVWTLLPYNADWRWLLEREDSPWYPTMRLFRQSKSGDWKTVLTKVRAELLRMGPTPPPLSEPNFA